ncbi:NADPH-dependent FMN reductase [Williamsia sterculiae]|uniref:NADPH-dependent FMN reductase n=1 Tax=Williamsia sterculiae TaxID=1344003 RepID=UPI00190EF950|nr:NAD(P)H-dependent oxidoreductase [Williamsia sterculiae]
MTALIVVGNPKPASRTRDAGERLATALGYDHQTIELAELGPALLGWGDPAAAEAVARAQQADVIITASPTFKATYTGLLKLFLDQFGNRTGLAGVVGLPLMLGAGPAHALAPELLLKPVLVELGATCPAQGLYQLDSTYIDDGSRDSWVEQWGPVLERLIPTTG